MAINKQDSLMATISKYVEKSIRKEASKVAESYKEQMLKDLDNAIGDVVAKTAVRLMKNMSIQDASDHLVITVKKDL